MLLNCSLAQFDDIANDVDILRGVTLAFVLESDTLFLVDR